MYTRKDFIQGSAAAAISIASIGEIELEAKTYEQMKTNKPKKGLILWSSQAGNTRRYGRLIAHIWKKEGLNVVSGDIKGFDISSMSNFDVIAIGAPVYNYTMPENVKAFLSTMPVIKGTPVASFVSFGGPEGNQHNTYVKILNMLLQKGGVPVGMNAFMNMSSAPFTNWEKMPGTLEHRHLPDEATYNSVREFSRDILSNISKNITVPYKTKITVREFASLLPLTGMTKLLFNKHSINKDVCIKCGTCVSVCPSGSIDLSLYKVDRSKCMGCFGCINNCPTQAMEMENMGEKVLGIRELMKKNGIVIKEPAELLQS